VEQLVLEGFEKRQMDWASAGALIRGMPSGAGGPAPAHALLAGVRRVLNNLEDHLCDLPKADQHLAAVVAGPIADGHVTFAGLADAVRAAGPEDDEGGCQAGHVVREGFALPFLCRVLHAVADVAGAPRAAAVFAASAVALADFLGEMEAEQDGAANGILDQHDLRHLLSPLVTTLEKLAEALGTAVATKGVPDAPALATWLEANVGESTRKSVEYVREIAAAALKRSIPSPANTPTATPNAALAALMPLLRAAVSGPGAAMRPARETAMLFAAQRFCHDAGHPPGLLTRIFRDLYNGDVLDEPAMQRWRDDTSDQTPGKTKATYDVTEYLVELEAEAEEVISTKKP
jgi:translation initiation factor 4G